MPFFLLLIRKRYERLPLCLNLLRASKGARGDITLWFQLEDMFQLIGTPQGIEHVMVQLKDMPQGFEKYRVKYKA